MRLIPEIHVVEAGVAGLALASLLSPEWGMHSMKHRRMSAESPRSSRYTPDVQGVREVLDLLPDSTW